MAIALVGQPNSGKTSVLVQLTGASAMVANYPGTSLELLSGQLNLSGKRVEVVDTPGIYSLELASGGELITREVVADQGIDLIVNVVDATSLARSLGLTLELAELGKPMLVLLNQVDRAQAEGFTIDHRELARLLGCPVFPFSAVTGEGVVETLECLRIGLNQGFDRYCPAVRIPVGITAGVAGGCEARCPGCLTHREDMESADERVGGWHRQARALAERVSSQRIGGQVGWLGRVEGFIDRPFWGSWLLILLMVAGFMVLVKFVGWMEGLVTELFVPVQDWLACIITLVLPPGFWSQVLSKGVPEGVLVPFALVAPAMLMVSFLMSLLEDTGLLARYTVVLERVGGLLGLSGQAVIPLTLGFGCRTPAVLATRILPDAGQRFIVVALLSIVIPCAATIGIITSVAASFQAYAGVLVTTILVVFAVLGWMLKTRYGGTSELIYELPPLRIPRMANLLYKIKARFGGFVTEVLPLLVVMSVGVRIIIDSGILEHLHRLEGLSRLLFGIPAEALAAVLITVIQRYLAPLVLLNLPLNPREATIAIAMVALSLPCLPVMVMARREVGGGALVRIIGLGMAVSFAVGLMLNVILP